MKIVYTIAGFYRAAGMERILAHKANYLAAKGYEILLVTTEQKGRADVFPLHPSIERKDLAIGYETNNGGSFLSKLLTHPVKQLRHRRRLKKLLMECKADVTVSMFCGDEGFLPRLQDGSKKVLEVHFSRFKRLQDGRKGLWALADRYRSRQEAHVIRRFDRFVALTNEDMGYWGHPANGVVIPNFLDEIPPHPSSLETHTVLAVGRYEYQKAFDRLIAAWAMLPKGHGWQLKLVGGGPLEKELKIQVVVLGLQNEVTIEDSQKDMAAVYKAAGIYALSSRYEGLPMVLLEAQAWGLPIVAFDCQCGPKDVVTDGQDGILVPEGNIEALSQALYKLICDDKLRRSMGAKAREQAGRWDKERIMQQWITLFNEI